MKILTISGSQRTGSWNTMLIRALPALGEGHTFEELDYSALPLFNQDLEAEFPAEVTRIKNLIRSVEGIIIATPEYNRSIPAPLKNLIDWTSCPYGDSAWTGKQVFVMGGSMGPTGTALAQADLRKTMLYLDAHVMGQPELYVGGVHEKFSPEGMLMDESTKGMLSAMLQKFATHCA